MGNNRTRHGGNDPGAVNGNVREKDYNLKVSQYIYKRLNELGIPATITRDTDETLDRTERVERILEAYGNSPNVIVLSNHMNAGGGEGAEVVYALRNNDNLATSVLESIGLEGQKMRKAYQRRLPEDPSKDYYFIHRLTGNTQPLLIEYGFIDNSTDLNKLNKNILDYGEAVVRAIAEYIGADYQITPGTSGNIYVVKKGDSLYSIANSFGVTVDELKIANDLTSNLLDVDQSLIIPSATPEVVTPADYLIYTVATGDTLYKIANNYGIGVNDIIEFNQLPSTMLNIGQQILIPIGTKGTIIDEDYYTVVAGDSLYKIAQKYGVTVAEIIEANNLATTSLTIGQKIYIPVIENIGGEEEIYIKEDESPAEVIEEETIPTEYVVKSGDSLYSIAKKFNITVNDIKNYNNLTSNLLTIGQILSIPTTEEYTTYYVKKGDSLYSIARSNNTTVDAIRLLNNLTSNSLSIGQVLILPK